MDTQINFEPIKNPYGIVLGIDEEQYAAVSVAEDKLGSQNVAVYGAAGTGKSRNFVRPNILACIDNKLSFIVNDPGGEIYNATSKLAAEKGMHTRVLNLSKLDASDGWDCLAEIKKLWKEGYTPEAEALINAFTRTIIEGTENGFLKKDPYFTQSEASLLEMLIKYVAISPYFEGEEYERHFGTCYDILIELIKGKGKLPALSFVKGEPDEPARIDWKIFSGYNQNTKNAVMFGLKEKLRILDNEAVKEVLAHNEIDLQLPGRKPCAYYIISPIMTSQYQTVLSLFYSMIIRTLIAEAESNNGMLDIPVRFFLDEFKTIGYIPEFEVMLANARKFDISFSLIMQSSAQLESCYPDAGKLILDSCSTHLAMGINDIETAKTISDRAGTVSVETNKGKKKIKEERPVILPEELLRMSYILNKKYIISAKGKDIYPVSPYACNWHYLDFYADDKSRRSDSKNHKPKWQSEDKIADLRHTFRGMSEQNNLNKSLSEKYDIERFRNVLRTCIGDNSQSSFAEKCGISKENLNRLLNSAEPNRPSKTTLRKIADNSSGKADYCELLAFCGYQEEHGKIKASKSFSERAALNAENIRSGMKDLMKGACIYPTLGNFIETYSMLYSSEKERYSFGDKQEYSGDEHPGAENCIIVKSLFRDVKKEKRQNGEHFIHECCETWFVLYFAETKGGSVVITDIATDGKSVIDAVKNDEFRQELKNTCDIESSESLYRIVSKDIGSGKEQRLLHAIFDTEFMDAQVCGLGFYLEEVPGNLHEFIKEHKISILTRLPRIKDELEAYLKDPNNDNVFKKAIDLESGYEGYGALITAAIRAETTYPVSWWPEDTGSDAKTKACIIARDIEAEPDEILDMLSMYAKELGIKRVGTCITYYPEEIREREIK